MVNVYLYRAILVFVFFNRLTALLVLLFGFARPIHKTAAKIYLFLFPTNFYGNFSGTITQMSGESSKITNLPHQKYPKE